MNKAERISLAKRAFEAHLGLDCGAIDIEQNQFIPSPGRLLSMDTFGGHVIFCSGEPSLLAWLQERFAQTPAELVMDTDNLFTIMQKLQEMGAELSGQHMRYLYLEPQTRIEPPPGYEYVLCEKQSIGRLYALGHFENAFNYKDDVLGIAAIQNGEAAAMAGADDRLGPLWQIGIDTLSPHRGRGLGRYLSWRLAHEIDERGGLSYYTTWAPNIFSSKIAIAAGFRPFSVGYTGKELPG